MGRQLQGMKKSGEDISFKYNDAGVRTEKTVNSKVTKYHLVGDKVTHETDGADSIYYTYDPSGKLISMNLNGSEDFYVRNAQGDIIALIDQSGTEVVNYTYDTWGKLLSVDGSLKDTVGQKNPYRYRGYRYDNETRLYYLQSRYYNPDWGRFINADAIAGQVGELLGHNIFAYCKNNPVVLSDGAGFRPLYCVGLEEETEEMYEASMAEMNSCHDYGGGDSAGTNNAGLIAYNLKNAGRTVFNNTLNGGLDKLTATVAAKYISTGLKYVELGTLALGTYVEKNPIGSFIKTATGKIGISSFIGVGVAGAVFIGSLAELGSRAIKKKAYGDGFWE